LSILAPLTLTINLFGVWHSRCSRCLAFRRSAFRIVPKHYKSTRTQVKSYPSQVIPVHKSTRTHTYGNSYCIRFTCYVSCLHDIYFLYCLTAISAISKCTFSIYCHLPEMRGYRFLISASYPYPFKTISIRILSIQTLSAIRILIVSVVPIMAR